MHLRGSGATLLRFPEREHRFTDFVMGPTLMGHRDVMRSHPLEARNRGEDTHFLSDPSASQCSVFSCDSFTVAQIRADPKSEHTRAVGDADITARGTVPTDG